jgi:hypothetical protein
MTPEQQRVAIAEACGWKNVAPRIVKNVKHQGDDITVGIWSDNGWIPDYLNDLNAMHDAEKVLGEKRIRSYAFTLAQVLDTSPTVDLDDQFLNIHATAAQRAEAFLRTIGKWEECK